MKYAASLSLLLLLIAGIAKGQSQPLDYNTLQQIRQNQQNQESSASASTEVQRLQQTVRSLEAQVRQLETTIKTMESQLRQVKLRLELLNPQPFPPPNFKFYPNPSPFQGNPWLPQESKPQRPQRALPLPNGGFVIPLTPPAGRP